MELIYGGLLKAWTLLTTLDPTVFEVAFLTIKVSGLATIVALLIGIPVGTGLAFSRFQGRRIAVGVVNAGMGMPPVVVGLVVSILLWRSGIFGALGLIYTPAAIVIGQVLIALPVVTALTMAAMQQLDPALRLQIRALGASRWQSLIILMGEVKLSLLAVAMAGFGAAISEVGASMMVGGNIMGYTRNITTAIALETSKGEFAQGIALGLVLLALAFLLTLFLSYIQGKKGFAV